jgi:thioredoxin reductase (NADPH)
MNPHNHEHRQVIIIGAGTAGLTAAIYAARANLEPLVIQGPQPGGQLVTTTDVENYPGFEDGILGPELMHIFEAQAASFGTEICRGTVTAIDCSERPFYITIDGDRTLLADALIIATGASPKKLGLNNEQKLIGQGLSYCATCDGAFFQDEEVAVVGGGDTAMEDALFLTRFASKIYLIHRRDKLRASKILQKRAFANKKIIFIWDTEVAEILGQNEVKGLVIKNNRTEEKSELAVTGLFIAIGYQPNTEVFREWLDMDERGYIQTKCDSTETNIPGVFACGDAQDHVYRQAVTAAGTGCMATIDAERWLQYQEQINVATAAKWGEPVELSN